MSGASACVDTPDGLQVFYRDQSQGIILGAVQSSGGWQYELIDGDRVTSGRTTGDVGFHIRALNIDSDVYLIYDSVLQINQQKQPVQEAVRLATRGSGTVASLVKLAALWQQRFLTGESSPTLLVRASGA